MAPFHIILFTCYEVILSFFENVRAKIKIKALKNLALWLFFLLRGKYLAGEIAGEISFPVSMKNVLFNKV